MNRKLTPDDLPKKVASVSRCYRAETSDVEAESGIYRVHQFTKVNTNCLSDVEEESGIYRVH